MQVIYHKDLTTFIRKLYFLGKHNILDNSYLENNVNTHIYIDIHLSEDSNDYKFLQTLLDFKNMDVTFKGTDGEKYTFLLAKATDNLSVFLTTTKILDTHYTTPLQPHLKRILDGTTT